ncbi:MAG: sigma-70 family RNA polymerase sigma factor [Caldilineaceae bacterium]|nr:sigma-70 family RNA polymerase sigma factor [Caldilineaceae bacterium]
MNNRGLQFTNRTAEPDLTIELNEEDLLARAANFDEVALGQLYDLYEMKIYSYVYRRTNDPTLAEDITAQVFLKMLEAIQNDKLWHSSFSGWLYRIAHNLVIDYYRRRDRQRQVSLDDAPVLTDPEHNPVESAELALNAEYLRSAMRRLTDEQSQVLSLRFLEGYSFGEIARMMDKTEGAVKALQHRAFATLRQLINYEQIS